MLLAGTGDRLRRLRALLGWLRWHKIVYLDPEDHKNFSNASVVSFGCSSRIQCPAFLRTMTVTSVATNFICCPSTSPSDFSPPMDNTGIVNFVCDSCTKSLAVCGTDWNIPSPLSCVRGARMPPHKRRGRPPATNDFCPRRNRSSNNRSTCARDPSPALPASVHENGNATNSDCCTPHRRLPHLEGMHPSPPAFLFPKETALRMRTQPSSRCRVPLLELSPRLTCGPARE